jgi:hypothetical protein
LKTTTFQTSVRRVSSSLALATFLLLLGCRTSILEPGVIQRTRNLSEYTAEGTMGRDFYDDRHYVGDSPIRELEADIAARYDTNP